MHTCDQARSLEFLVFRKGIQLPHQSRKKAGRVSEGVFERKKCFP